MFQTFKYIDKFYKVLKKHFWLILVFSALLVVIISFIANISSDYDRIVANKLGKNITYRLGLLEKYANSALHQTDTTWMDIEHLPEDMVIYRYVYDTLQAWCNQFPIENDNISTEDLIITRFSGANTYDYAPLKKVNSKWQFLNLGPKWYIIKNIGEYPLQIILGLEIKNEAHSLALNGVNRKLGLPERFSLYPISESGGIPVLVNGTPMLKIVQEDVRVVPLLPTTFATWCVICLIIAGLMLYLIRYRQLKNMFITIGGIYLILGIYYVLGRYMESTSMLFSPTIYASGNFFYSLGALLLVNSAIFFSVCCAYLVGPSIIKTLRKKRKHIRAITYTIIVLSCMVAICIYVQKTFTSIVLNSNITLELFQISGVNIYTILVYLSYITLLMTLPMLIQLLHPIVKAYLHIKYFAFSRFWRTVFCVLCAGYLLILSSVFGFKKEESKAEIWANTIAIDRDITFELQLRNMEKYISADPIIAKLISNHNYYNAIINRIAQTYFINLSQDYNVLIFVNEDRQPNADITYFFTDRIKNSIQISDESHFYYSRTPIGRASYTGVFLYYVPNVGVVRILIGIDAKSDKGGKGYASILGTKSFNYTNLPSNYSYGRYIKDKLVAYRGEYAYPTVLSQKQEYFKNGQISSTKIVDGYVHFINQVSEDEIVVISRPKYDFMQYLVYGFLIALLTYCVISIPSIKNRYRKIFQHNYYKSKLNTVLFLSLSITLVFMAVVSVVFVYRRNNLNIQTIMTNKISTIQSLVGASCANYANWRSFLEQDFTMELRNISDYTKSDITLYNIDGKAFKSTAQDIFEKQYLSPRMNQDAYSNIMFRNRCYFIHKERVDGHGFYCMYAPIFNKDGKMLAIIGTPFTDNSINFTNDAVSHTVFIITIFLILLIFARSLTTSVINKMLIPLINMGRKMIDAREDGLEYIIYERDDELSSVVRAYNLMVHDLSISTKQLSIVERDKAWREMARQVAHEIKTPLTPIKLQIQRIIRLRDKKDANWEEKFDSILPIIISSIDQLTDTANDFSNFAKLYSEKHQVINIDQMATDAVSLFDEKDNIDFEYIGLKDALVLGPKPQLNRVFINLITNSIQAIENYQALLESEHKAYKGHIRLSIRNSVNDNFYDIVFEDNGPGVKDENRNRLFTPNFTTKSGGSGLGLAISKNILDVCGGDITYSSSFTLEGACFTIHLPKYNG